jgi:hypothetical protein
MSPSRRKTWLWLITASVTVQILGFAAVPARVISLSGSWRFRLDPDGIGVGKRWFAEKLDDTVVLPGSTDTNGKGIFKNERVVDRLSRVWDWKGPAWYQRDVVVPESWRGKRITLLLERTKTTRVWADDVDCGAEDTLSAPQIFDLTRVLTPGRHTITVLVDNAKLPPVGPSHAVDERTQTNWNGIVGRMELRATDPVWLDEVQVYPDVGNRRATIRAVVGNIAGEAASGRIEISGRSWNTPAPASIPARPADIGAPRDRNEIAIVYDLGRDAPLWDEFHPATAMTSGSILRRSIRRRRRTCSSADGSMPMPASASRAEARSCFSPGRARSRTPWAAPSRRTSGAGPCSPARQSNAGSRPRRAPRAFSATRAIRRWPTSRPSSTATGNGGAS